MNKRKKIRAVKLFLKRTGSYPCMVGIACELHCGVDEVGDAIRWALKNKDWDAKK